MDQSSALGDTEAMAFSGVRARRPRLNAERAAIVAGLFVYLALLGAGWWAIDRFLPDRLSLTLIGHTFTLKAIHHRIISDAALVFTLLPAALWLECVIVGWERSSIRQLIAERTPSVKTDLAVFILGQGHVLDLVGRLMMLGASLISGLWIRDWIGAHLGVTVPTVPLPMPLQVVFYFYVATFFDYWTHRLDHSRWFWPLHRYHHSAEDFCIVTSGRQHPAAFTAILLINVPMVVLGATAEVMIWVNVLTVAIGFLIHSKIDSNWGWIGRYLIQSPNHHRLHHILDMSEPTGHFAMAPIWDHLFGTWRGEADQSLVIGVDTPYRQGFWIIPDMLRDYWHFWRSIAARAPA